MGLVVVIRLSIGVNASKRLVVGLFVGLASTFPLRATASQASLRLSFEPSCGRCRIALERVATLGDARGPVSETGLVIRGPGFYLVADPFFASEMRVYDLEGRYVRTVGREGAGPGEYRFIRAMRVGPADSLYVFDALNSRITVLSPFPAFQLARTAPLQARLTENGALLLGGDRVVVNGSAPAIPDWQLHLIDLQGQFLRSFATPSTARGPAETTYSLASGAPDRFWAASYKAYRITQWSTAGSKLVELSGSPPWWQGPQRLKASQQREAVTTSSGVVGIQTDVQGRLWILSRTPERDWEAAVGADGQIADRDGLADLILELVDPSVGRLIATRRLPAAVGGFADRDHLFTIRELADGDVRIDVWKAELER